MILLQNLFDFLEFCAENNTYIQHTPGATGSQNRFSRFPVESATEQQSNLGFPRMEVVQLPFGIINDYDSAQRDDMSVRVRVIIKLSDKYDYAEQVTAMDNAKRALMEMVNYILTAQEGYTNENCLICAFDINSAKYQFIDRLTYGGNAVGCELSIDFKQYIDWDNIVYGDLPGYPTFCDKVDECLSIPTADGDYILTITNGVKSWSEYSPTGQVVISKTQAEFLALVSGSTLEFPATYKITDIQNGLYVNTLSASSYSQVCNLSLNCPKTYETTTLDGNVWKGIWRASKTANVNDLFIWGGVVWKNKTGAIGTATDVVTLDSTNWGYIDRNNFSNNEYTPLSLICFYDFQESWINYLQDEHTNIIGVDWHLNQIYGLNYNPALNSDWNCMSKSGVVFSNNQLFLVANNLGNVISNKANGFIQNNDGNVFDNKFCPFIANNEQDVYENIAAISDIDGAVNDVYNVNGGTFFFSHNFGTSPLTSGNSLLFNYIPEGASITNIKAYGALTGTTIEIGLETDAEGLINESVGLLPLEWSGVSAAATANRSLKIKATGGNITAGTLTVKVEFTI